MRHVIRSVSGDNLVLYFSTILWLRLEQETVWVNINLERRGFHSNIVLTDLWALSNIKQCTQHHSPPPTLLIPIHPQPPPSTQNIFPPTPPIQNYAPHIPHSFKIMPHTPPLNPSHSIMSHPPKITLTQINASLTVTYTKCGPVIHIHSNFSLITR